MNFLLLLVLFSVHYCDFMIACIPNCQYCSVLCNIIVQIIKYSILILYHWHETESLSLWAWQMLISHIHYDEGEYIKRKIIHNCFIYSQNILDFRKRTARAPQNLFFGGFSMWQMLYGCGVGSMSVWYILYIIMSGVHEFTLFLI